MAVALISIIAATAAWGASPEFVPSTKQAFTGKTGSSVLTGTSDSVKCTSGSSGGEITGSKLVGRLVLIFLGCKVAAKGELCTVKSTSAKEGEIVTKTLKGELGTSKEAPNGLALLLEPETTKVFLTLATTKCVGESPVEGTLASELEPINGTAGGLIFAASSSGSHTTKIKKVGNKSVKLTGFGVEVAEARFDTLKFTSPLEVTGTLPPTIEERFGSNNPAAPDQPQACEGDPISCANGNLTESQTDLTVGGRGPSLSLERTYNSLLAAEASEPGPFGYGWTDSHTAYAVLNEAAETLTVHQDNGSDVVFHISAGKYVPGAWVQATLIKSGSNYVYTLPDQSKLEFNSAGQLTSEKDRNGNALTLSYTSSKQLETTTAEDGCKLTFTYNGEGLVDHITDPMGHSVKYTYSAKQLASVRLPGDSAARWKFEYDASHELTSLTDGRGHTVTTDYDSSHRVNHQADALKRERTLKYTTKPVSETIITTPNGSTTVEQFNSAGSPTKMTRASGTGIASTTEYQYNPFYNLIATNDPNNHTTEYGYNATNDRTSEKDPNGNETKWTYNTTHDVVATTTPKGETTTTKRDAHGNPEVIERPAPGGETQQTTYKYNEHGDVTEEISPLRTTTKFTYDAAGDRESATDPEGNKRTWKYNEDSQQTSEVSPRGTVEGVETSKYTTNTELDEQGRPIKITDPLEHVTEYRYDGNGNLETLIDGNGHTTKYTYDSDNERTKAEEPNKTITETSYDSEGQTISHTDGNNNITEFKRNLLEEVEEEVDPLKRTTKKTYDKAGNLKTLEDPLKHTTTYKYDAGDRVTEASFSSGSPATVKYEYDKDGLVKKLTDGTGETLNTYDELDRLTESKNGHADVVKYEYNLEDNPVKITYPNTKAVTRAYDKDGRLEKVTDWNAKETKFSYDPDSNLTATIFPSGTEAEDSYTYNEADQMNEVKMTKSTSKLGTLAYTRDSDGQVKKETRTVLPGPATVDNTYDENNRLTASGGTTNKYDKANNPTQLESSTAYTYDGANELESGPEASYAYNQDGQRTEVKPTGGPTTKYSYDQAANLTGVERLEKGGVPKIEDSYTYNGENVRQSQTVNGTTTHLTWDSSDTLPLVLNDETNNYIYGANNLPIEQISSGGTTLYLHHDQQGSTRLLTNATGGNEAAYTYNPYGTLAAATGTASTPLRYDAQYTSTDTGLLYLRARTYDPATAQFLSVDPSVASTNQPYVYTQDNPLNNADPTGGRSQTLHFPPSRPPGGAPAGPPQGVFFGSSVTLSPGFCGVMGVTTAPDFYGATSTYAGPGYYGGSMIYSEPGFSGASSYYYGPGLFPTPMIFPVWGYDPYGGYYTALVPGWGYVPSWGFIGSSASYWPP